LLELDDLLELEELKKSVVIQCNIALTSAFKRPEFFKTGLISVNEPVFNS